MTNLIKVLNHNGNIILVTPEEADKYNLERVDTMIEKEIVVDEVPKKTKIAKPKNKKEV